MSFFNETYELSHSWEEKDSKKLAAEEIAAIKEVRVRKSQFGLQLAFMMKSGKTKVAQLSTYSNLKVGDRVDPKSVTITQVYSAEEDRNIYRADGRAI